MGHRDFRPVMTDVEGGAAPPTCLNCGAVLHGRYCSDCAQAVDDHHRPILRLIWEGVEGITHLDGRLARTLPPLFFHPGALARDHLEGRRARHVPPFRLFLIALLIFMLALETAVGGGGFRPKMVINVNEGGRSRTFTATPRQMADVMTGARTPEEVAGVAPAKSAARAPPESPEMAWFHQRARRALANPEFFQMVVFTWAHRLAILLLPILAAQLALLYAFARRFWFYDHLVVAMQFLAFVFLIFAVAWLTPNPVRDTLVFAAMLWTPVNLFMLLRGAYGSSVIGAGLRAACLSLSTLILFVALVMGLLLLGLQQL